VDDGAVSATVQYSPESPLKSLRKNTILTWFHVNICELSHLSGPCHKMFI
jgi:hypothetical protein